MDEDEEEDNPLDMKDLEGGMVSEATSSPHLEDLGLGLGAVRAP